MTSNGFGFADPPAGSSHLYALPHDCCAIAHLRSVVVHTSGQSLTTLVSVESEDPAKGNFVENLRAFFTYGPLDEEERIPRLDCQSEEERDLFTEVERRLELQRRLSAAQANAA